MSDEQTATKDPSEMSFLEHLEEMRFMLLKILAVFVVALTGVLIFFHTFNKMMLYPLNAAKEILAVWVGDKPQEVKTDKIGPVYLLTEAQNGNEAQKTGPFYIVPDANTQGITLFKDNRTEGTWYADIKLRSMKFTTPIVIYFYVGFLGALGISLPAAFYFIARFVAPGLKKEELAMLRPGIIAAIFLFIIGVCFAFFLMLPMGIAFMSWMSQSMQMEMFPDAQSYYSMVIFLTMAVGVTFELPLLEFILIYIGALNVEWLKNNRRMVFLIILIFSTVITPPDCITQIALTTPLYLMYEVALRLGERARKRKLRREAEREKLEEEQDKKEQEEYVKEEAKRRIAAGETVDDDTEEKSEESDDIDDVDRSHYMPDDYDPNNDENYGMGYYEEDYYDPYHDYDEPEEREVPNYFGPDWDLNRPDTSFMSPDWSLNELKTTTEVVEPTEELSENIGTPEAETASNEDSTTKPNGS